jgi:hypothetical protein
MSFVAVAHSVDSATTASLACNKPTGTVDNDLMFAFIKRNDSTAPSSVPSGWTLAGDRVPGGANSFWLYYKLAASEGASYTWDWLASGRTGISIVTRRGEFNTASPIDVVSNTSYVTSDTTLRAAAVSAAAVNSTILFFGGNHTSSATTGTIPTAPASFTEDVDYHDGAGRFHRYMASLLWTGSGSTGNMDAVLSATSIDKHAFAVILTPDAGGSVTKTPAQAVLTVNLLAPSTNAFTYVAIQDTLINESGQAVANAANIRLMVWYNGEAIGAPDYSANGQTSNASGSISWSVTPGTLANGQAIFYVAQDSISYSNYTCGRVVPTYG